MHQMIHVLKVFIPPHWLKGVYSEWSRCRFSTSEAETPKIRWEESCFSHADISGLQPQNFPGELKIEEPHSLKASELEWERTGFSRSLQSNIFGISHPGKMQIPWCCVPYSKWPECGQDLVQLDAAFWNRVGTTLYRQYFTCPVSHSCITVAPEYCNATTVTIRKFWQDWSSLRKIYLHLKYLPISLHHFYSIMSSTERTSL